MDFTEFTIEGVRLLEFNQIIQAVLIVGATLVIVVEKSSIAAKPITDFLKWWGRMTNVELEKKVDKLEAKVDEQQATNWRTKILRFADELARGEKHTKEHFEQVMRDIDSYEEYCAKNPDYKNSYAITSIAYIKEVFKQCLMEKKFTEPF